MHAVCSTKNPHFSNLFVPYLVSRGGRLEENLMDHLFNSSEKRLARILPLLARLAKNMSFEHVVPTISQESLAEMVETTRLRSVSL